MLGILLKTTVADPTDAVVYGKAVIALSLSVPIALVVLMVKLLGTDVKDPPNPLDMATAQAAEYARAKALQEQLAAKDEAMKAMLQKLAADETMDAGEEGREGGPSSEALDVSSSGDRQHQNRPLRDMLLKQVLARPSAADKPTAPAAAADNKV